MKLNKLLLGLMAAGMFAACSNDDAPNDPDRPNGGNSFEGDGYLAVSINLPTTPASRAANDVYDDGIAEEYKVADAALLLFQGTSESEAKFVAAYDLGVNTATPDLDNDNITTYFVKAVQVKNVSLADNGNLYALVMVNYKNIATLNVQSVIIDGTTFEGTFSDLQRKIITTDFKKYGDTYFFMTNAPLSTTPGGTTEPGGTVQVLAKLNGDLKATKDEAESAPNANIYVERAVAKATLSLASDYKKSDDIPAIKTVEWALGNVETSSYIVRNLGNNLAYLKYASTILTPDNYRFVGNVAMGITDAIANDALYRTYWCIDPNYSTDKPFNEVAEADFVDAGDKALYCRENTFDVAHQNYKNTTRAVLKVTFDGGTFYTLDDETDKAYTQTVVETYPVKYIVDHESVKNAVKTALVENASFDKTADIVKVEFTTDNETKVHAVSDVAFSLDKLDDKSMFKGETAPELTDADKTALIAAVNAAFKIYEYTGGVSYYDLRFKHFAGSNDNKPYGSDNLAPWETPASTTNTSDAYPAPSEQNYLGRYGMVRNNWYDIEITNINNVGSPVIPDANTVNGGTPDDNKKSEQWIGFTVNVLSWAKRTQQHEF